MSKPYAVYCVGAGRLIFWDFCLKVIYMVQQIVEMTVSHQIFPRTSFYRFSILLHEWTQDMQLLILMLCSNKYYSAYRNNWDNNGK